MCRKFPLSNLTIAGTCKQQENIVTEDEIILYRYYTENIHQNIAFIKNHQAFKSLFKSILFKMFLLSKNIT